MLYKKKKDDIMTGIELSGISLIHQFKLYILHIFYIFHHFLLYFIPFITGTIHTL